MSLVVRPEGSHAGGKGWVGSETGEVELSIRGGFRDGLRVVVCVVRVVIIFNVHLSRFSFCMLLVLLFRLVPHLRICWDILRTRLIGLDLLVTVPISPGSRDPSSFPDFPPPLLVLRPSLFTPFSLLFFFRLLPWTRPCRLRS
jgi:hypothetical protein